MLLGSHFNYWAFPTVIILITVHRPSFCPLSLWTRINLRLVAEMVVECGSLWQPKIRPSNGVHSVDALVLYGNAIYSIWGILFNRVNPDRVTICDAIRRADAFLFLSIRRIIVFSQQTKNQHYFDLFEEAPYILTINRIIMTHSLLLLNSNLEKAHRFA